MSKIIDKPVENARKELRHAFRDFDTNKSGYIERHELAVLMIRLTDYFNVEPPSDLEINEILKYLDPNGDGKISQS